MRAWLLVGMIATLSAGCGGDDSSGSNASGGTGGGASGSGGSGGSSSGGSAGVAATGGGAGTSASGGSAGTTASGGSAGTAGAGGTGGGAGAAGAGGGSGKQCGGLAGLQCDSGEWCDYTGGTCGANDQDGVCKQPEMNCGVDCSNVVCGCDGNSYCSACQAHLWGTDTTGSNSCITGNGGSGAPCAVDGDCQSGFKCCKSCGAFGCPIACTQVGSGQCPALP